MSGEWYAGALDYLDALRPFIRLTTKSVKILALLEREVEVMDKAHQVAIDDMLRIQYYDARYVYRHRAERLPHADEALGPGAWTWEDWFRSRFNVSLDDFMESSKRNNLRERIMAHEIAKYGWSPLEPKHAAIMEGMESRTPQERAA